MLIGRNTCTRRLLKNGRCTVNFLARQQSLLLLLLSRKGFVQVDGRVPSAKASRQGKHNARAATRLHTRSLSFMLTQETKITPFAGSTLPIRSATHIYTA